MLSAPQGTSPVNLPLPLAEAAREQAAFEGTIWLGGLILALLVVGLVLAYLRKRVRPVERADGFGFELEELRALRDRGELTPEEYETLRDRLFRR